MAPHAEFAPFERVDGFGATAPDGNEELLEWLRSVGTGFLTDGFIRLIDPSSVESPVGELLTGQAPVFPFGASAFGDVFFTMTRSLYVLRSNRSAVHRLGRATPSWVAGMLSDVTLRDRYVPDTGYAETVERLGRPDLDECFGYVPLLVLGGGDKPDNLERVGLATHLELIYQAGGVVTKELI